MNIIILKFSTLTYAIKARRLLDKSRIKSKVVKLTGREREGCGYGLQIYEKDFLTVASILRGEIDYEIYNGIK